jgi:hypothetical protein
MSRGGNVSHFSKLIMKAEYSTETLVSGTVLMNCNRVNSTLADRREYNCFGIVVFPTCGERVCMSDNSTAAAEKLDEPLPPRPYLIYKNKTADEERNTLWRHIVLDFTQAR